MSKKYVVTPTDEEREQLRAQISSGASKARMNTHAKILLNANEGWQDRNLSISYWTGILLAQFLFTEGGIHTILM